MRHCFAFLHSGTCTNAECRFPHLSEKEIVDRVAAYNAEKAALQVAGPCILLDEESIKFWNIAGVCIDDLSEDWEIEQPWYPEGTKVTSSSKFPRPMNCVIRRLSMDSQMA